MQQLGDNQECLNLEVTQDSVSHMPAPGRAHTWGASLSPRCSLLGLARG